MAAFKHEALRALLTRLAGRIDDYKAYRSYYEGTQETTLGSEEFRGRFGELLARLNYNRCQSVVDAHADKMQVTGFNAVDLEGDEAEKLAKAAKKIWDRNRMDRRAGEVHTEMFTLGDAYVIVWPHPVTNLAVIYPQLGDRCTVRYSEHDPAQLLDAVKIWRLADGKWRVNYYAEDRIERYITTSRSSDTPPINETSLRPFEAEGEPAVQSYAWGKGLPVFHFANNAKTGQLGRSELANVLNLQDQLNQSLAGLLVAGEFQAFPQRWAIGVEGEEYDPEADPEAPINPAWKPGPNRIWTVASELAKFGQFEPAQLDGFLKQQDGYDTYISRATRVPVHWLGMVRDFPSGEAILNAETPFTAKIVDRMAATGNGWEDVESFAIRLELRAAQGPMLSTMWRSPEPRSEQGFWTVAQLKLAAGVPEKQIWREHGYSETQIAEWEEEKKTAAATALKAFNANQFEGAIDPEGEDVDNTDDQPAGDAAA